MARPDDSPPSPRVSRRRFLTGVVAPAAALPLAPLLPPAADAATAKKAKPAAKAPAPPAAKTHPDMSVARSADERTALERQWKQMVETVEAVRKAPVDGGGEIATGALPMTPRRMRGQG